MIDSNLANAFDSFCSFAEDYDLTSSDLFGKLAERIR